MVAMTIIQKKPPHEKKRRRGSAPVAASDVSDASICLGSNRRQSKLSASADADADAASARAAPTKKQRVSPERDFEEGGSEDEVDLDPPSHSKQKQKLDQQKPLTVQETCDLIAELSESVLEDPEQAFASTETDSDVAKDHHKKSSKKTLAASSLGSVATTKGPSKIQQLLTLANCNNTGTTTRQQATATDSDDSGVLSEQQRQYTAQLAIMSLLAIFKDILPAYRIRVPTSQEMAVKVSKETKKMWDYERALLHHYQQFLMLLEMTWEIKHNTQTKTQNRYTAVSVTALLSLAELLKAAFHFNFRSNLLTAVIRHMNNRQSEPVRRACCDAIEFVFATDAQGDFALEVARQVAKLIKDRAFAVHPDVLRTFAALPLRVHVDEAVAAKLASQANAKRRKRDRETAEIEAELREGKATVDKIVLARSQSDTLQAVTLTYFRVLKSVDLSTTASLSSSTSTSLSSSSHHIAELLPPALEGLARFAHLINIDTVMDLLSVLRDLLKQVDLLPVDAALNCILTAFQTLQGPGKEMKIDQKEYIMPLYSQLPRLCTVENSQKHTDIMIQCLQAAFIKRREYSTVRVAAFFKQILTTALHTPPHTSIPLQAFARQLIQRYPSAEQMLENEQDVITEGQYTPNVEDPEHANPFATSAWELATLKFHLHSGISTQAVSAASSKMLNLPTESPEKLRMAALKDMDELYIPFLRIKKKHPLHSRQSETSTNENKQKRNQVRFITPRARSCLITEN